MRACLSRLLTSDAGLLAPLFCVLLDALWAYPWFVWIGGLPFVAWAEPPLGLASAMLLILAAEVISRLALGRMWSLVWVRGLVLPALLLLLGLLTRLELGGGYALWDAGWGAYAVENVSPLAGGMALGVFLIWRGIAVAREDATFNGVYRRFLLGLAALVALLVLAGAYARAAEIRQIVAFLGGYVAAYFGLGLLTLALASFRSIQEQMHQHESGLLSRRWLSLLLAVVLAIVGLALGLASVFSMDLAALLARPLSTFADWLLTAFLYGVALPAGFLATGLIYALRFLIQLVRRGPPPDFEPLEMGEFARASEREAAFNIPPEVFLALKWGLLALLVLAVLFVLARGLFRYRRAKAEAEVEEESESLWSWDGFKGDLRSLLAWLLARFRRRHATSQAEPPVPVAAAQAPADRVFSLAEIYQGLLWEGRSAGVPRRQAETPYEYQRKLQGRAEAGAAELAAITEAYVRLRYGSQEAAGEEITSLNRLWRRLRAMLRGEDSSSD